MLLYFFLVGQTLQLYSLWCLQKERFSTVRKRQECIQQSLTHLLKYNKIVFTFSVSFQFLWKTETRSLFWLKVAIEVVYVGIQTIIYSLLIYSMIGFQWSADKFLWFYFYIFMCFVYFTLYGMMLVALTPNYQIAAITMSFFLSFWNLFSGFMIPRTV